MSAELRIGCSSWTSEAWWGRFYPAELTPGARLRYYAARFDTVEVDASYYHDPAASVVRHWARETPAGFRFALKFPRDLLDLRRPVDEEGVRAFEGHVRELGPKLGAVVVQFPPSASPTRAGRFLAALLDRLDPRVRYAVELRHPAWFEAAERGALLDRLASARAALAWSFLTYLDVPAELTTDFVYLRCIGDHRTVPEAVHGELRLDRARETEVWAERVRSVLARVTNVFAFFNNHFAGFAPASANLFREAVGLPPVPLGPAGPSRPSGRQSRLGEGAEGSAPP